MYKFLAVDVLHVVDVSKMNGLFGVCKNQLTVNFLSL